MYFPASDPRDLGEDMRGDVNECKLPKGEKKGGGGSSMNIK